MDLAPIVRAILEELGPYEAAAVSGVWFVAKPRPDAEDLARGCEAEQLGGFWGSPRELGRPGEPLPDCRPAEGEIAVYLENIKPCTPHNVATVLRHELAHARGYEEEEIRDMGLGTLGDAPCCPF